MAGERVILHVDMNAFFASVEQQFNPRLRGKPIIVCGNPKSRTVVAACSYEAKAYGIKNGMAVFEAKRLCPQVLAVSGNPEKYADVSRRIFTILAGYTPQVEIFSVDEAFMDVTQTYLFFGKTPEDLARLIKARIRTACGLACSVGVAPNKLIAKLASKLQKPDGLVRIRQEDISGRMGPLPVESLCGIGDKLKAALNDLGIITCADLGRAPENLLTAKFGVIGRCLKRMGQGQDHSPVALFNASSPVKSMGHAYTLPRNTDNEREIFSTLLRLCEQVGRRLRAGGYQGRTVGLTLRYADFSAITRLRTISFPTDAGLRIYDAAAGLFREHCQPLPQRVRLVGAGVSNLTQNQRQLSFLAEDAAVEQLDRCMDRINDRFGEFTVARASAFSPLVQKTHGFLQGRKGPLAPPEYDGDHG